MSENGEKTSPRPTKHVHFAGIDGIRALAIIGVIAFHTRPSLLQGGFIGVTMFFAVTGFLTTRTVLNAVDSTGTFGYGRYLIRRIKRIWPPILATLVLTPALVWLFAPSLLQKVVSDTLPSALFASNWVYIFRKVPYFQAAGLPSPLTHLWFLGVTMQFYILWPLAMLAFGKLTKSKWIRSIIVIVIMAASSTAMFLMFDPASTSRVYYGLDTRLAELAAGALLAIWMTPRTVPAPAASVPAPMPSRTVDGLPGVPMPSEPRPVAPVPMPAPASPKRSAAVIAANIVGAFALAALLAGFWFANGYLSYMYQGGYLVTAIVSLAMLACAVNNDSIWAKILGAQPLRYIGSRSFSLYLVHYPLLQIMNPATRTEALPWWGWIIQIAVILVVGEVFYQLVEAARKHRGGARMAESASAADVAGGQAGNDSAPGTATPQPSAQNRPAPNPQDPNAAPVFIGAGSSVVEAHGLPQRNLHVVEEFEAARSSDDLVEALSEFESDEDTDLNVTKVALPKGERTPYPMQPDRGDQVRVAEDAASADAGSSTNRPPSRRSLLGVMRDSGLRPGAWIMSVLGVITVLALTFAPVNWAQVARARAIQLNPALAQEVAPGQPLKPKPKPRPKKTTPTPAATKSTPSVKSKAEKVPNNFDISKYHYDAATQSCSADITMVGDSVTSGTSDFIRETFPNGYIDGKPNRQMPEAEGIYRTDVAAGHDGSVVIFGLGTNGIIENEQEVQKLIDATGGKPTFFVTIRMPYPWQETNNNKMLRAAAAKNPNVGIIDWHGYSEGHSEYFGEDGIHPGITGAEAYATMLRQAICGR
ncbi:acyltransferase family protein [Bifidobacterium pluvialisilvae]|uniref:acyltransferase family protein n=1 Tax=Bifidobacterium pluvialisilvae TaxID=2834436 RepID=UPI0027E24C67|nr:acyltransferase family protein [Bifidobacterium pluvialisilvae]